MDSTEYGFLKISKILETGPLGNTIPSQEEEKKNKQIFLY